MTGLCSIPTLVYCLHGQDHQGGKPRWMEPNPVPSSPLNLISDLIHTWHRTCCGHHILRIFLKHVNWNLSSLFSSVWLSSRLCIHTVVLTTPVPWTGWFSCFDQYSEFSRFSSGGKWPLVLCLDVSWCLQCLHHPLVNRLFYFFRLLISILHFVFPLCICLITLLFPAFNFRPTLPALSTSWSV